MRVGSLFAGIGGFDLGLERAGFSTAWFCEQDPYCTAVLNQHWPGVPVYPDIRELKGAEVEPVEILCGGFPCQDLSVAGTGAGLAGERSGLWTEYARLIGELRPRYVIVENVSALLARGLGTVLGDLAALGYDAEWDCIPASAVGAPHRRDRIWLIAYPGSTGSGPLAGSAHGDEAPDEGRRAQDDYVAGGPGAQRLQASGWDRSDGSGTGLEALADTERAGLEGQRPESGEPKKRKPRDRGTQAPAADTSSAGREARGGDGMGTDAGPEQGPAAREGGEARARDLADAESLAERPGLRESEQAEIGGRRSGYISGQENPWAIEPDVGRVAHGVPARVDRLRALGNALVPQIPEWIGHRIREHEEGR